MNKYKEIIKHIKNQIINGELTVGKRLPAVRSLANKFNCSVGTVLRAYKELEINHIIYAKPQSGYYLLSNSTSKEEKTDIIDFSSGFPGLTTFHYRDFQHCLNQAINIYKESLFSYSNPKGLHTLIAAINDTFKKSDIYTKEENIYITTGSQQAIDILVRMPFPNNKTNVLLEQPSYYGVIKSLELNNVKAIGITRDHNGINLKNLENHFKNSNVKFFFTMARNHTLTGTSYTKKEKEKIIELANKYNVYIVEDDIMLDFERNSRSMPLYYYDISEKVIYLKSFSKILLPGLRVSATILPKVLTENFLEFKRWTDRNSPILAQGALEIFLKNGMFEKHKSSMKGLYSKRLSFLLQTLDNLNTSFIEYTRPKSGYFLSLFVKRDIYYNKIIDSLKKQDIIMLDTRKSFLASHQQNNHFALSVSRANKAMISKGVPIVISTIHNNFK